MVNFPNKLFLTGFMGSGKSTFGKKLAKEMAYDFIDLDTYIENEQRLTVSEIFKQHGEEFFRSQETKSLNTLIKSKTPTVISLGGGTLCFNDNLGLIKTNGFLVYLQLDAKSLFDRLHNAKLKRPLIENFSDSELQHFIESTLKTREPFYLASHLILNGLLVSPKLTLPLIAAGYKNHA